MTANPPPHELATGAIFAGRYIVEALLGAGGMGAVYRVDDIALGEPIALKVLLDDANATVTSVIRFRQEVRLARRVTHPNVARVFDLGEHAGVVFMTMELIDGVTLRQRMVEAGRIATPTALRILHALAEGVAAAHAVGVVHRDLKPTNVMIERTGRVVITDFGIARKLDEPTDLTVGPIGTPSYMAPEQLAGAPAGERTDVYQLGIVAHEVLVGGLPKRGAAVAEHDLLAVGVPRPAAAILARCLETDAEKRTENVASVTRELAAAIAELSSASTHVHTTAFEAAPVSVEEPTVMAPTPPPSRTTPSSEGVRSLAVMPFRARGIEIESIGDAFTDEVLDQLSRTRGLRVFAAAATRDFGPDADPRAVVAKLGADLVVQGSLSRQADRLQFNVRLVDGSSLVQLWSDRFETDVAAVISAAETIARRVAETLRIEILVRARACALSEEAASAYFSARRRLRVPDPEALVEARDNFARCIELEPAFLPAYAGHASASLRCWFFIDDPDGALARSAEWSLERAAAQAPEMAETHLAAALHAVQHGAYPAAVRALERALAIAPMYADAHEYLGALQVEAGRLGAGMRHLERAIELDPTLVYAPLAMAREREIVGDHAGCDLLLAELGRNALGAVGPRELTLRTALWRHDTETMTRLVADRSPQGRALEMLRFCVEAALGRHTIDEVRRTFDGFLSSRTNPRYLSLVNQVLAEGSAFVGDHATALSAIDAALRAGLIDLRWLELCPLLDELRADGRLDPAIQAVRTRAAALFR